MKRAPARSAGDDKKLQQSLKKLNVQPIQAIEEVNMFKSDGNVIHFAAPKGAYSRLIEVVTGESLTNPACSPRCGPRQHLRHLRQRRGQGAHRARPRHPEPARPRLACLAPQACRELPEHAEG